ncbi:signal peptidase II [Candidatus Woesearchaeota archaeon]|nr:signal peptidase II [Candidatus Woesearchaeota archaeon]
MTSNHHPTVRQKHAPLKGGSSKRFKQHHAIFFIIVLAIFTLDQLTKYLVRATFSLYETKTIVPSVFSLTYSTNTGAAFGLLQNQTGVFIWLSVMVLGFIIYYYDAISKRLSFVIPTALLLGGVLGNLFDRIVYGRVTDFLDFHVWPIFNVADAALSIGCIILVIVFWREDSP